MSTLEAHSVSEEGYTVVSRVGDFELTIDAAGEDGPEATHVLIATYASCYIPAFRVGCQREGYDDIGRVEIEVEGDLDEDEDLTAIRFHIKVEEDLDDDELEAMVEHGEEICHVHAALREELEAEITAEADAF